MSDEDLKDFIRRGQAAQKAVDEIVIRGQAAAFLDALADKLETCEGVLTGDPACYCQERADNCRAMAKKLRGEVKKDPT